MRFIFQLYQSDKMQEQEKKIKLLWFYGAKTYMLDDIFRLVKKLYDEKKITAFVDVFGGAGNVVLNVPKDWKVNRVYNDIDLRLYNLLNVLKDEEKRKRLFDMLDWSLPHRKIFEDAKQQTEFKDDVEMAYNYLYRHFCSFNANDNSFGIDIKLTRDKYHPQIDLLKKNFFAVKYLKIENLDYKDLIKLYDSPTTFFYIDPPYLHGGATYKFSFTLKDFQEMHDILKNIKGYWLMNESGFDFPKIIKIFGEPKMVKEYRNGVNTNRTQLNSKNRKSYRKEGFWFNF